MADIFTLSYHLPEGEKKFYYEHALGRQLLSYGLNKLYGLDLSPKQLEDAIVTDEHGKPRLRDYPGIHYNISHCDDLIICGFARGELGVDAEPIHPFVEAIFRRLFTPEERQFYDGVAVTEALRQEWFIRFWTLKESYLKYSGDGLYRDLNSFSFSFDTDTDPMGIRCSDPDVTLYQQFLQRSASEPCYVIAACLAEAEPVTVTDVRL